MNYEPARAIERALEMEGEGADVVEIGGESTRPGATPLSAEEELSRVLPVLRGLAGRLRDEIANPLIALADKRLPVLAGKLQELAKLIDNAPRGTAKHDEATTPVVHDEHCTSAIVQYDYAVNRRISVGSGGAGVRIAAPGRALPQRRPMFSANHCETTSFPRSPLWASSLP